MDIDDEAHPKIRKSRSKWKCGFKSRTKFTRRFVLGLSTAILD